LDWIGGFSKDLIPMKFFLHIPVGSRKYNGKFCIPELDFKGKETRAMPSFFFPVALE
jgi:hypothetical protein